jgi:predicted SprT family Zn-dependent metalloprotease
MQRFFKQLEFAFQRSTIHLHAGRDHALELQARQLLRALGADKLAREIRVEWNPRLKTCAGRADYREKLISLNPLLLEHDTQATLHPTLERAHRSRNLVVASLCEARVPQGRGYSIINEIDRTLRHELAHLLAQWRVGRCRIAPHGPEWRQACVDLGLADEARCHNLPFATKVYAPRYVYRCPNCEERFPRVRRIRRAIACLACCREYNGGDFDPRFRLKLIR